MSQPIRNFLPYVLPHVPGAPDVACVQEIRKAAIEFCEQSKVWQSIMPAIGVTALTAEYAVPVPTDANSVMVMELYFRGSRLPPKYPDQLKDTMHNWFDQTGEPRWFTQLDQDNVRLIPIPAATESAVLRMRTAFKPTHEATTLPDILWTQYRNEIAQGAMGRLMLTPDKPWTNVELGAALLQQFDSAVSKAKVDAAKGFSRAPLRAVARFI